MRVGIVIVGGVSRDPGGPAIPALHWLIERLAQRHAVDVFTLYGAPQPDHFTRLGASIHHAGGRPLTLLSLILARHRRSAFDLLHAFWLIPGGVVAVVAGRLIRRPVLAHIGGGELVGIPDVRFGHQLYWKGRLWAKLAVSGANRITAASDPVVRLVAARGRRAERVPLGVDLDRWPPVSPRPRDPGRPARIVHVATLNPVKDQEMLLRGARRLADSGVDFHLDVAGPDVLHGQVQALSTSLGLDDRVRFHGHLPHDRLRELVKAADVHWLTSRFDTGPLVVLEAALAGVPTVGTAVGHVAEWAPDAAVAVNVRDHEALARETATLLEDDPRRLAIGLEAQRLAIAQDADWTARRFEELYEEAVSATRRTGHGR